MQGSCTSFVRVMDETGYHSFRLIEKDWKDKHFNQANLTIYYSRMMFTWHLHGGDPIVLPYSQAMIYIVKNKLIGDWSCLQRGNIEGTSLTDQRQLH